MSYPPQGTLPEIKGEDFNVDTDSLQELGLEDHHTSYIFPTATNETVTFTAGGVENTFGNWAEIIDNNAATFSAEFAVESGHITAFMIEASSIKDKVYLFEISYGDLKVVISRYRFISGETTKLPAIQQIRVRALDIPVGETVYYRMACETAEATCQLHFRYHYHS